MTRQLWYTDGSTAGSISGSVLAFGTAKARPTTRNQIYDNAIVAGLVALGFTQHNQATRDDVWTSTGESGGESINFRTHLSGGNLFRFSVGTKVDGSNVLQGAIGENNNAFEQWSIPADTTFDYIMMGTADFFWLSLRRVSDNVNFNVFLGNLERDGSVNSNVLTLSSNASAGTNVVLSVGSNPQTLGYNPGDFVQIVSNAAADAAQAQTIKIINTTTSTIEVDSLALGYSTGARIGAQPSPIVRFVGQDLDADDVNSWYSPLLTTLIIGATTDITGQPGQLLNRVDYSAGSTGTAQDGFGTGTTANKRTRRFTCRTLELRDLNNAVYGRVPGVTLYPGTNSYYPNDTGTWNRVSPSQRFLAMKMGSASSKNWVVGKAP
jgi:hypothetical protein